MCGRCDTYTHAHRNRYGDRDGNGHSNRDDISAMLPESKSLCVANSSTGHLPYADCNHKSDTDRDLNRDCDGHSYTDRDSHRHRNHNRDTNDQRDGDCYCHSYTYCHGNAHGNTDMISAIRGTI